MWWDTLISLVAVAIVVLIFWKMPDDEDEWQEGGAQPADAAGPAAPAPAAPGPDAPAGGGVKTSMAETHDEEPPPGLGETHDEEPPPAPGGAATKEEAGT